MIYVATCPSCGIFTRVQEGQRYECCACDVPYVLVPETPVEPEPTPDAPA